MTIEELVDQMTAYLDEDERPDPCSEGQIADAERVFRAEFSRPLLAAYKRLLRRADGVKHNGLTVLPLNSRPLFRQTIFEANLDLRSSFSSDFVHYAQRDEELYVLRIEHGREQCCAIEFVGKPVWKEFRDDVEMFEFLLSRAWE